MFGESKMDYLDSAVYGDLIGLTSASVTMTRKL